MFFHFPDLPALCGRCKKTTSVCDAIQGVCTTFAPLCKQDSVGLLQRLRSGSYFGVTQDNVFNYCVHALPRLCSTASLT